MPHQPRGQTLAVLAFHRVGEPPPGSWHTWFSIPEVIFVQQLTYLARHDWQVIDAETFLAGLVTPGRLPARAALLTFDDGYRSIRDAALARLLSFGYPAVLFMPTDFIGGDNAFDADSAEPRETLCDWVDLRALDGCGISIQSHAASHRPFSQLDAAEQERELTRSKAVIEAGLGKRVELFAYPYGDDGCDPRSASHSLHRAGYKAGFLYGGGASRLPVADPYHLARVAMGPDTDLAQVLTT